MMERILAWLSEHVPRFVAEYGWRAALIAISVLTGLALLVVTVLRFLEIL